MNKLLFNIILLTLLSAFLPSLASAAEIILKSEDQMEFALQYMNRGEFSKAIGELERFIYFFPEDENVSEVKYLIAVCFVREKQYENARNTLKDVINDYPERPIAEKAIFLIGESYYEQGQMEKAETYFSEFIDHYAQSEFRDEALYRQAWSRLKENRWEEASESFSRIESDSPLYPHSIDMAQKALQGKELPKKNPRLSGVLAGIIPGLGHVYCGRPGDGLKSFLLNGLFIWAAKESFDNDNNAVGGIASILEVGWYTGNIYSAVNCAHKYNKKQSLDFIRSLPDEMDKDIFMGGNRIPALTLKFNF